MSILTCPPYTLTQIISQEIVFLSNEFSLDGTFPTPTCQNIANKYMTRNNLVLSISLFLVLPLIFTKYNIIYHVDI